jgi:tetratricopeptide (TPR) repeat protein
MEYAFDVPASLDRARQPLRVEARLRHRSHDLALQERACSDAKGARGRAFDAATRDRMRVSLDPCAPQPVTELARAEVWIGEGALTHPSAVKGAPSRPSWRRLFDLGLGEQHQVQERLEEGRPSLEKAWSLVENDGTDAERAMVLGALAWLPAHEGRTEEALESIDRAERFAPGHPALESLRASALEQVWRWSEAAGPLRLATEAAPRDDGAAARLAIALGSDGDESAALEEAQRGLLLTPRDADLLRVQALAVRALNIDDPGDQAETAYLACRPDDDAPAIRAACAANVPGCDLERLGVHVHVMRER